MRNVVVGSFLGFVLAAAFLAACGGGGTEGSGPAPAFAPGAVRWTALGARQSIATGVNLSRDEVWRSTAVFDNADANARHQYATLDLGLNVDTIASGAVAVDVGILPSTDGSIYATDPLWLGTVEVATGDNRRTALANVRVPPMRFQLALRLRFASSASARVLSFGISPYDAVLP